MRTIKGFSLLLILLLASCNKNTSVTLQLMQQREVQQLEATRMPANQRVWVPKSDNSRAYTFHYKEIRENRGDLYKEPISIIYRKVRGRYKNNQLVVKSKKKDITILNTPDQACQKLVDPVNGLPFEKAASRGGEALALVVPDTDEQTHSDSPERAVGSSPTEILSIVNPPVENRMRKITRYDFFYILTCVRKLTPEEKRIPLELREDDFNSELRLFSGRREIHNLRRQVNDIYSYREENVNLFSTEGMRQALSVKPEQDNSGYRMYSSGASSSCSGKFTSCTDSLERD